MILNFGSINVDLIYRTAHLPAAGETLSASEFQRFLGGKGINQTIAAMKAGGAVHHVGAVGEDSAFVLDEISRFGVNMSGIAQLPGATGHAVIAVGDDGDNLIIIHGGANQELSETQIDEALATMYGKASWVLLQNETNLTGTIIEKANAAGYKVAFSAAPFIAEQTVPYVGAVDLLAVNTVEANALAAALNTTIENIPVDMLLVTHGAKGAILYQNGETLSQPAFPVTPLDTTGAGDTFLGAFLARLDLGDPCEMALRFAAAASALQVTREGAAPAIPNTDEVHAFLAKHSEA